MGLGGRIPPWFLTIFWVDEVLVGLRGRIPPWLLTIFWEGEVLVGLLIPGVFLPPLLIWLLTIFMIWE